VSVRGIGPFNANSGEALLPALRAGLGIALLPDFIIDADLARGAVDPILPDWRPTPIALHLLTPPGIRRPARVEALLSFLTNALRQTPTSITT
jgi:DNA-binding transcriptional LysR family regulator